jgi:thioredoxin-dependent peroxiredoxin
MMHKDHFMGTFRILGCALLAAIVGLACTDRVSAQQLDTQIKTLKLGDVAKDFEFQPLEGKKKVKLSALAKDGPVVLVVLRGFPGYQCPICGQQVNDFRQHAKEFAERGAKIVLVYPGPPEDLKKRAREFLKDDALPKPMMLVIDPAYKFTTLYGLRWNADAETAYPSTFVLDRERKVMFRKVSRSHGDRAEAEDVLMVVSAMKFAEKAKGEEIPGDLPSLPFQKR